MISAYFITVFTIMDIPTDRFTEISGEIVNALHDVFTDMSTLCSITKSPRLDDVKITVEVEQTNTDPVSAPIIARIVMQADAPQRYGINKHLLALALREKTDIMLKVQKKAITHEANS